MKPLSVIFDPINKVFHVEFLAGEKGFLEFLVFCETHMGAENYLKMCHVWDLYQESLLEDYEESCEVVKQAEEICRKRLQSE